MFEERYFTMSVPMIREKVEENYYFKICKNTFSVVWSVSKFYMFWIIAHFVVTHLYTYFCTPASVWGFISSPFMAIAPHCKGFQWIFNISVNTIQQMWLVFGLWLASKFSLLFQGVTKAPTQSETARPAYSLRKRKSSG